MKEEPLTECDAENVEDEPKKTTGTVNVILIWCRFYNGFLKTFLHAKLT